MRSNLKILLVLGLLFSACTTSTTIKSLEENSIPEMECTKDNIINNKNFEKKVFAYIFSDRFSFIALECGSDHLSFNEEKSDPQSLKLLRDAFSWEEMGYSGEIIIRPDNPPVGVLGGTWVVVEVVGPLVVESPEEYYSKAEKRRSIE